MDISGFLASSFVNTVIIGVLLLVLGGLF